MKLKLLSLIFIVFLFSAENSFAQARLVIGTASAVYMNISGGTSGTPIYLVIDNAANTAISCCNSCATPAGTCPTPASTGAGYLGWIISEGQYNYVKWRQLTSAGAPYTIPFGKYVTANDSYLPFTFTQSTAGAADLTVSTWGTAAADNAPWAAATNVAAVGNMIDLTGGTNENGGGPTYVIDRWWTINTTASASSLKFTYRGAENTTSFITDNVAIQHWNGSLWDNGNGGGGGSYVDCGVAGTNSSGPHTVTGTATFANFSPYVLVNKSHPLPVTWLNVSAECIQGNMTIKWSTASEENSDYFTVEKSSDGTNFTTVSTVKAAGNSSTIKNYSVIDHDAYSGTSFYRIKETDFNGDFSYSNMLTVSACNGDNIVIYGTNGGAVISINALEDSQYNIEMYDLLGKKIVNEIKNVPAGNNTIKFTPENVASAIYILKVYNSNNIIAKKVFIRSNAE